MRRRSRASAISAPACTSTFVPKPLRLSFRPASARRIALFALPPLLRSSTGGPPASVDDQIGVVVVVEIAGEEGARLLQRGRRVRGDGRRRILEVALHVSQHDKRARCSARSCRWRRCRASRRCRSRRRRGRRRSPALSTAAPTCSNDVPDDVPPERQSRRSALREDQIHPAVLVEIDDGDAARIGGRRRREGRQRLECALSRIDQHRRAFAGDDQIDGAIVVEIAGGDRACVRQREAALAGDVRKRAVAVVPEHGGARPRPRSDRDPRRDRSRRRSRRRRARRAWREGPASRGAGVNAPSPSL